MTRRLLALARDSRFALVVTLLFGLLAGLLTIAQASALSQAVDRVFLGGRDLSDISGLLRLIFLIVILRALLAWGSEISAKTVAVRIKNDLRQRLFDKLLCLGPAYTRRARTGELVNTLVEGVEALDAWFSQYLPQLVIAALVPFAILVVVFPRDPLSGLILLLTAPLIPVFMVLIGRTAEALTKRQWDTLGRLSAHFLDSLQGLATLKELGRSRDQADSIAADSDRFRDRTLGVLRITFLSALVLELVAAISTALVAVEVGLRLLYGRLAFQPALFLLLLAPEFYIPLRMLGQRFHASMSGATAASRIFSILDLPVPPLPTAPLSPAPVSPGPLSHSLLSSSPSKLLNLTSLSYTYPGDTRATLQDLSLAIHSGEHIGLVGSSGVGKTTLAALLLRFIEPSGGRITINGRSSTEIPLAAWRALFAWVPQDPYLFHDTLAANLRLAKPDATDAELQIAARLAHLDQCIESLPEGYATLIGEHGARLSAGQAQRLALARAFLKDAPILILDEPTSSLDPGQEALVETSLRTLMHGRTILTIAHRLNTVFQSDRILVLEGGRIVESGTHRDLIAKAGAYAVLINPIAVVESQRSDLALDLQPPVLACPVPLEELSGSTLDVQPPANQKSKISNQKSSTLLRLLGFLRGSWSLVALSVLLGVLTVASNVGLMGTSAFLISAAALHPQLGTLEVAIVGVRFFGLARGVFRYTERLTSHNVTFRLLARLRTWFYRALEPLAPARLLQYRSGDLLGRILSDVAALEDFYVRLVSPSLVALLVAAGMTFFFSRYAPILAWTYLAFMLLLGLGLPLLAFALSRRAGAQLISLRSALQVRLVDGLLGLPDLLAFGQGVPYARRLHDEGRLYGKTQRRLAFLTGLAAASSLLLVNLGLLAVLVLAVPLVRLGQIPGVLLAVLTLAAAAGFEAVLPLPQAAQTLSSSTHAARRLFEIVATAPAVQDLPSAGIQPTPLSPALLPPSPFLLFTTLSFTYPGSDSPALQDISFQLPPGKHLAIVGPSGAGKSTLINLLLRFWDYSHGQILLNGRDLRAWPQEAVRRQFSVLSQHPWFFNDTLRRNILMVRPSAADTELQQAAERAQIHDFIVGLPHGYETFIGERGYRLSAGERQRLGFARLLLKDAPIFLLDEPTANLDPLTERRILDTLLSIAEGRSLLLVTHRLVGLEAMHEILVLDRARLVERGTHVELLALNGLYRRLWDLQNRVLLERGAEL
jgi:ATP-binding cassette, subfamily C, bacterial CydCD